MVRSILQPLYRRDPEDSFHFSRDRDCGELFNCQVISDFIAEWKERAADPDVRICP